jgi:hypothetical protein
MTALPFIVAIHVDREPTVDMFDLAFARLGGFLDGEAATLEALGDALSVPKIGHNVRALHVLHRGGGDSDPMLIKKAIGHLTDLRDLLFATPNGAPVINPQALQGILAPKDVDAAIRYVGARVDDQIAAFWYALREA